MAFEIIEYPKRGQESQGSQSHCSSEVGVLSICHSSVVVFHLPISCSLNTSPPATKQDIVPVPWGAPGHVNAQCPIVEGIQALECWEPADLD